MSRDWLALEVCVGRRRLSRLGQLKSQRILCLGRLGHTVACLWICYPKSCVGSTPSGNVLGILVFHYPATPTRIPTSGMQRSSWEAWLDKAMVTKWKILGWRRDSMEKVHPVTQIKPLDSKKGRREEWLQRAVLWWPLTTAPPIQTQLPPPCIYNPVVGIHPPNSLGVIFVAHDVQPPYTTIPAHTTSSQHPLCTHNPPALPPHIHNLHTHKINDSHPPCTHNKWLLPPHTHNKCL